MKRNAREFYEDELNISKVIKTIETETKSVINTDKIIDGMNCINIETDLTINDVIMRQKISDLVKEFEYINAKGIVVIKIQKQQRISFWFIAIWLFSWLISLIYSRNYIINQLLNVDFEQRLSSAFQ